MSNYKTYSPSRLSPVFLIGLVALFFAACGGFLYWLYGIIVHVLPGSLCISEALRPTVESVLFWVYVLLFVSMWTTYFISKAGSPSWLRVPSLRRLLLTFSEQWNPSCSVEQTDLIEEYRKKGTSGISSMAMLAAVAGLELAQANVIISTLERSLSREESVIILIGVMCGFIALLCFIIASDALDSMFNKFNSGKVKHQLIHRFYFHSIHTRYFGFVLLLCGAIFLIAFHNRLLGAAATGLVFAIGYSYWFPKKDLVRLDTPAVPQKDDKFLSWAADWPWWLMARLFVGAGIPIFLFIHGAFYHCP